MPEDTKPWLAPEGFLDELTELAKKWGVVIGGCGCCGSPYMLPMNQEEREGKYYRVDNEGDDEPNQLYWSRTPPEGD